MSDKILKNLIKKEIKRQKQTLNLIPSENIVSREVLEALGSPLVNKYSEGYPAKRYYAGNKVIDEIEVLAKKRARQVFHLGKKWHVNVQPYSGSPANMAVYYALLQPGDKIMGMNLVCGGHLTHGWSVSFSGRFYKSVQYGVKRNGYLDYREIKKLAKKEKPKIIIAGATAYPRIIDFKRFSAIAHAVGAYFLADISHIAGLIAAGVHPSPFAAKDGQVPADIVTATTQKTLRGPRGAIIFANCQSPIVKKNKINIASAIDKAVFPGLQGGPHDNQTAAIAVCLKEAASPAFKKYGRQVVKNAKILSRQLQKFGFELISGGTDNHLMLIDLSNLGIAGREAQDKLEQVGIIVNCNTIPYETRSSFDPSGIRLGTPAITSRGMKEKEMKKIAELIYRILIKKEKQNLIAKEVKRLCSKFPVKR
jgi:glycine hydroxymethyltransferase